MKKYNNYWFFNWLLFIGALVIVLTMGGVAFYFVTMNTEPPPLMGADKYFGANRTMKKKKIIGEQIVLNSGDIIRIDNDVELLLPTYTDNNLCRYHGKVTNLLPQTGRVLMRVAKAVVEFNYRYIINVEARNKVCGNVTTAVTDTLVGVVFLNRSGIEQLHFVRDLDNGNEGKRTLKIDEMVNYSNLKVHDVEKNAASLPDEIVYFYRNNER